MSPRRHLLLPVLSIVLIAAGFGCAIEEDEKSECVGAKCDDRLDAPDEDIADSACDESMFDLSGRRNEKVLGRLGDPIALALMKADNCPTSFQELNEILDEQIGADCAVRTRVISEVASTIGAFGTDTQAKNAADYRTVTNRQCADDETFSVLFSQFGMGNDSEAPEDYEAIAFDDVEGVFNYYKLHSDGTFGWFGNSADFLDGRGQELTVNETDTAERDCAACHVGGGLIMKELPAPWLHWNQSPLPGASDLTGKNPELFGTLSSGANLEGIVKSANRRWNTKRIERIRDTGTVKDLLRPLFCTEEINLDSAGSNIQNLVDGELAFVSINNAGRTEYETVRDENKQEMITGAESSITGPDTAKGNTFPIRAHIDTDYVDKLVDEKLIDAKFRDAVLMVDFTRPLFSDDRCDLLRFAPDLDIGNKTGLPNKIRDGFIDNIGTGATSAARELRRNLKNFTSSNSNSQAFETFENACDSRDGLEATRDAMMLNSLLRSRARELRIMEFSGSLAFDKFEADFGDGSSVERKSRLSPKSCEVVTRFVGVADPADDE